MNDTSIRNQTWKLYFTSSEKTVRYKRFRLCQINIEQKWVKIIYFLTLEILDTLFTGIKIYHLYRTSSIFTRTLMFFKIILNFRQFSNKMDFTKKFQENEKATRDFLRSKYTYPLKPNSKTKLILLKLVVKVQKYF